MPIIENVIENENQKNLETFTLWMLQQLSHQLGGGSQCNPVNTKGRETNVRKV